MTKWQKEKRLKWQKGKTTKWQKGKTTKWQKGDAFQITGLHLPLS